MKVQNVDMFQTGKKVDRFNPFSDKFHLVFLVERVNFSTKLKERKIS